MLILTRRESETVRFPDLGIVVAIQVCRSRSVRLSIEAPREIRILRGELPDEEEEAPKATVLGAGTPDSSDLGQQSLDTARLAIHLAQNQLRQNRTAYAEMALDNALQAIEELELAMTRPSEWREPSAPAVREPAAAYGVNSPWRSPLSLEETDDLPMADGQLALNLSLAVLQA